MKIKKLLQKLLYAGTVGISIFLLFFIIGCSWIGYDAKHQCKEAQDEYKGDCVEALISLLQDEKQGFRNRNDAIWTLGQFGDSRALPALQNYYTGIIPDREPLNEMISQYELEKAIALVKGGTNISAFVWRNNLFD
jgi:hypothetical protein